MDMLGDGLRFFAAMAASLLPFRLWARFPGSFRMPRASFASAVLFVFLGAGIGIPGFLEHAGLLVSETNAAILKGAEEQIAAGIKDDDPKAVRFDTRVNALAIVTFLLLTPKGWLTMYFSGTGALRMAGAWFDDPLGDPLLTGLDVLLWRSRERRIAGGERQARARLEGPETPDRIVTPEKADIPGCDLVIVSARRKPGWNRGVAVYTATACYRIGEPLERTIAGNLRTLYPLTEHKDFEVIRQSVTYDLPEPPH